MLPDSDLTRTVRATRKQAQAIRQSSKEARLRAETLMARARSLRARHRKLVTQESEVQFQPKPEKRLWFQAQRIEVLEQLKQSLSDLETIRMTPEHDPELLALKEDIRGAIARG